MEKCPSYLFIFVASSSEPLHALSLTLLQIFLYGSLMSVVFFQRDSNLNRGPGWLNELGSWII